MKKMLSSNDIRIDPVGGVIRIHFFDTVVGAIREECCMSDGEERSFHLGNGMHLVVLQSEAYISPKRFRKK